MAHQLFNKHDKKYYLFCGSIHVSTVTNILMFLQLLYIAIFSVLAILSMDSYVTACVNISCFIISTLLVNVIFSKLFVNPVSKISEWYWPGGIVWSICTSNSSFTPLMISLVKIYFWNNEKEMLSFVKSDLRYFDVPEKFFEADVVNYTFAFLVAKTFAVFILEFWILLVFISYKKYLNDLQSDPVFVLDENEASGHHVQNVYVNAQDLPDQIQNGQILQFQDQVVRIIFKEENEKAEKICFV
uniref:Uncharacterized protein n=1 Tax=Panagrolaimus sp. ES5 TaxID=591445 RepID=A0AC34F1X2_9BILA